MGFTETDSHAQKLVLARRTVAIIVLERILVIAVMRA